MKDRVPLYPGRVTLTPVPGQPNKYDMVRADEPTQAGTPLNKATLLPDAVAALYGLGPDAVPGEALMKLAPPKLLASYKTAGAISWKNITGAKKILVAMIAGGGGGNAYSGYTGGNTPVPGASGVVDYFVLDVTNNQIINGVVGAGGLGKQYNGATMTRDATDGGTTSFGGKTVAGGMKGGVIPGGNGDWNTYGGQSPGPAKSYSSSNVVVDFYCFGRYNAYQSPGSAPSISLSQEKMLALLNLLDTLSLPFCMATCSVIMHNGSLNRAVLPNGNVTASCHYTTNQTGNYIAEKGTDPGCGGGSSNKFVSGPSGLVYGSDGCDGGIFIYDISGRGD